MPGILFIDTETSGMADFNLPTDHARQPRLVQLAAVLMSHDTRRMASFSTLIKPDGWQIEPEAGAVHGITVEQCDAYGIPIIAALMALEEILGPAEVVVAHNMDFDARIIDGEFRRAGYCYGFVERIKPRRMYCTMQAATPVCKLPGRRYGYKWPSLAEAHRHFFGKDFDGAHGALADARACARVYFELIK